MNILSLALAQENLTIAPKGVTLIPNLGNFISAGLGAIFLIAFLIFLVMLVWGGIQWLTAGSDKENAQKARDRITNALIGVAIVASAWAVTRAVEWFFCVDILNVIQLPSAVEGRPSGGGNRCGGSGGGGGGGGSGGGGIASCPCGNGGCASVGNVALGNASGADTCFRCTAGGWQEIAGSNRNQCPPITCGTCP